MVQGDSNILMLASKRLHWLSSRQQVISENIANADTAGYQAKDVQSFASYLEEISNGSQEPGVETVSAENTWGRKLSENNVVLEEQMINANEVSANHRLATSLYRKAHELFLSTVNTR